MVASKYSIFLLLKVGCNGVQCILTESLFSKIMVNDFLARQRNQKGSSQKIVFCLTQLGMR